MNKQQCIAALLQAALREQKFAQQVYNSRQKNYVELANMLAGKAEGLELAAQMLQRYLEE